MEENQKAMDKYMNNLNNSTIYKNDIMLANSMIIDDFETSDIKEITGGIIALVAKTGGGKTYLLRDLLSHIHKNYDRFYLFSGTARLQHDYDFFPKDNIYQFFDEQKMNEIWEENYNKKEKDREKVLVICDDVINDPEFIKSQVLKKSATGARHIGITIIILTQFLYSLKPIIRENLRLIIAFENDNYKERRKFIDEFLSLTNPRVGSLLYKRITSVPYQTIVVAVYKKDKHKIFKYIAKPTQDSQLKLKEKKKYTEENYEVEKLVRRK